MMTSTAISEREEQGSRHSIGGQRAGPPQQVSQTADEGRVCRGAPAAATGDEPRPREEAPARDRSRGEGEGRTTVGRARPERH